MTDWIDADTFQRVSKLTERFVDPGRLPDAVYTRSVAGWSTRVASFDRVFGPAMIDINSRIATVGNRGSWYFLLIEPDPVSYYQHHFGVYGACEVDVSESGDIAWEQFSTNPGNSPADALMYSAGMFVCLDDTADWFAVGERDREVILWSGTNRAIATADECGELATIDAAVEQWLGRDQDFAEQMRRAFGQ